MKTLFILIALVFSTKQTGDIKLPQRPIRVFHGLGSECFEINPDFPFRKCIETGAGFFKSRENLIIQALSACDILEEEIYDSKGKVTEEFKNGFHLEGRSQGGLIARMVFQYCPKVRPLVRRILTIGTPNLGVNKLPDFHIIQRLGIGFLEWTNANDDLKKSWSFFQFRNENPVEETSDDKTPITFTPMIKDLLKKIATKKYDQADITYATDKQLEKEIYTYKNLEAMINIQFTGDKMVAPISSSTFFMQYQNIENTTKDVIIQGKNVTIPKIRGTFTDFDNTRIQDKVGLYELWKKGRMVNCAVPDEHLWFPQDESYQEMLEFLFDGREGTEIEKDSDKLKLLFDNQASQFKNRILEDLDCSIKQLSLKKGLKIVI